MSIFLIGSYYLLVPSWLSLLCCYGILNNDGLLVLMNRIMQKYDDALQSGSDRNLHGSSDDWLDDVDVRHRLAARQLVLRLFIVSFLQKRGQFDGPQAVPLLFGSPAHRSDADVDPQTRHRQRRHRRLALERRTKRWIHPPQYFQLILITTTRKNRLVMLDSFGPVYRNTLNKNINQSYTTNQPFYFNMLLRIFVYSGSLDVAHSKNYE